MSTSGVPRTAIATFGVLALTAPVALAAPPAGGTAEPAANTQISTALDSLSTRGAMVASGGYGRRSAASVQ